MDLESHCHGIANRIHPGSSRVSVIWRPHLLGSWSRVRWLPGVGHIECGLFNEWWWIHAPADEETSSAAEEHTHHQKEPKVPQPLYGEGPHTAPGATAVFIGTAYIVCGIESFKIPAMFFGFCASCRGLESMTIMAGSRQPAGWHGARAVFHSLNTV